MTGRTHPARASWKPQDDAPAAGSGTPEFFPAPLDGLRCMRLPGRYRRRRLPRPATPPADGPPSACFLCHPESDPEDQGSLAHLGLAVRVLRNAFPIADRAFLVAPAGEEHHARTPGTLAPEVLAELLACGVPGAFREGFDLEGLRVAAFVNVGEAAGQSRRHPHLQVVGFRRERAGSAADPRAVARDVAAAVGQRLLPLPGCGSLALVIPAQPGMTFEAWIAAPAAGPADVPLAEWAAALGQAARACERGVSGSYNVVLVEEPRMIRILPRGISERAGLEFSCPEIVGSMVAATVEESVAVWRGALAGRSAEPRPRGG